MEEYNVLLPPTLAPAIPLLGIHLEKTIIPKDLMYQNVHHNTIYTSQDVEATYMSINRGMDEEDMAYIYNGSSVQFSRSVVSDSLRPHESQHARLPCPSPTPGVHPDSRPSGQ